MTVETGRSDADPAAAAAGAVVRAAGISKVYDAGGVETRALEPCDLELRRGEMVSIMGPSGSGKSTLLHLLSGLDTPTSGTVEIDGRSLSSMKEADLARLRATRIGFVLQRDNLVPTLRLDENVAAPLMLGGAKRADALAEAHRWLDRVGLENRRDAFPSEASGGEAQRAVVARACCVEPALIVADEPTGALDSASAQRVVELLAEVTASLRAATVVVTHDADVAAAAQRRLQISDGQLTPSAG
ncbi:MAG TPA: ABC transporter ATP-binding protein [Thermoleophilaceae bacterium]|jgi:ABC-type lipoprotein export system ATPase subunit